jgi:DNA-binding NarL/FixJ family response regulator
MKKASLFLISVTLLWAMIKLLEKRKDNHEVFTQREQEIPNLLAAGFDDNEIASFLRVREKGIQEYQFYR